MFDDSVPVLLPSVCFRAAPCSESRVTPVVALVASSLYRQKFQRRFFPIGVYKIPSDISRALIRCVQSPIPDTCILSIFRRCSMQCCRATTSLSIHIPTIRHGSALLFLVDTFFTILHIYSGSILLFSRWMQIVQSRTQPTQAPGLTGGLSSGG